MNTFIHQHEEKIIGKLEGFDRVLFRGTLRSLSYNAGLEAFLTAHKVRYKDFSKFAESLTNRVKEHAKQYAEQQNRPYEYLPSSSISKERRAMEIAQRDDIRTGLICVLSCVETCIAFNIRRTGEDRKFKFVSGERKCLYLYFYYMDKQFGLMHVRLQSWLPFPIQVCLNGREYLARRMDRANVKYEQHDNCFTWIEDLKRAQKMLDSLITKKWAKFLDKLSYRVNPLLTCPKLDMRGYYWTIRESEYATDIMFKDKESLSEVYPLLVRHAIENFSSRDVFRFLGRKTNARFNGEVTSNIAHREEGIRIKHWVEENSIKMYDKQGCVLRIEVTINNPQRFRVRRMATRKGQRCMASVPMRKGVADIVRRIEICNAANKRYLEALSVVTIPKPVDKMLDPICKRITRKSRPYRALRPINKEETLLFKAVMGASNNFLEGFRNKDIRDILFPRIKKHDKRRIANKVSRLLRLLRAHKLIRKVSGTLNYRITEKGYQVMTTSLTIRNIDLLTLQS